MCLLRAIKIRYRRIIKGVPHDHVGCIAEVGGPLATEEELQRLQDILAAFPTTEAEDQRLLSGVVQHCSPASYLVPQFSQLPKGT